MGLSEIMGNGVMYMQFFFVYFDSKMVEVFCFSVFYLILLIIYMKIKLSFVCVINNCEFYFV